MAINEEVTKLAWEAWEEDQKTNPNPVNPTPFIYGFTIGYKQAMNQFKPKWIPVSEMLPEIQEPVLVYMPKNGIPNVYVMWRLDLHDGNSWFDVNFTVKPLNEATYWMPLPLSPERKEEGEWAL